MTLPNQDSFELQCIVHNLSEMHKAVQVSDMFPMCCKSRDTGENQETGPGV